MATATAASGGSLAAEVEDDMLVDNAATATMLSPGVWVQRPGGRTPAARGIARRSGDITSPQQPLLPMPLPALTAEGGGGAAGAPAPSPASAARAAAAAAAGPSASGGTPGSPGLAADPDLAYLHISDDRERAEREYLQQDSEHMAALEEAYARLSEQNAAMQQQLAGVRAAVDDVADENRTIKQLLAMLQVQREDFVFNPHQTIAATQEAVGMRLLHNLEGSPPGADAEAATQQQPRGRAASLQEQTAALREQQAAAAGPAAAAAAPDDGGLGLLAMPGSVPRSSLFDASPGALLPLGTLGTPAGLLRTVSPKIAALRSGDDLLGAATVRPPPTSPYDFPAESQIAAAALVAKQGDAAAALLTLLDKAIEGRQERQAYAAASAAARQQLLSQPVEAQQQQEQPQEEQQQQQQEQPQQQQQPQRQQPALQM